MNDFRKVVFLTIFILFLSLNLLFSTGDLVAKYKCGSTNSTTTQLTPHLSVSNYSGTDINLSKIKIRYYYTVENPCEEMLTVDYAVVGETNITSSFSPEDETYHYFELGFTQNAGELADNSETSNIELRVYKEDWTTYEQSDDYSFNNTITASYEETDKIAVYYTDDEGNDIHVWGILPDGTQPDYPDYVFEIPGSNDDNNGENDNTDDTNPDDNPELVQGDDYLTTSGTNIIDKNGNIVRLTGINFFGFETQNMVFQGLWSSDLKYCLDTIADLGFNLIRVPISIELVSNWVNGQVPMPKEGSVNQYQMNEYLDGMNTLEIMDFVIDYCEEKGLKIMFDMHEVLKDRKRNGWIYDGYTVEDYYTSWEYLANRYCNSNSEQFSDVVIAMDLFNEPHGKVYMDEVCTEGPPIIWNNSESDTNFKYVAEKLAQKILAINPNLLIMVEGIHCYPKDPINNNYTLTHYLDKDDYHENWWGGNLRGVKYYPIDLGEHQAQLVYEPHDYGPRVWPDHPWFEDITYENQFTMCWQPNWFYIYEEGIAPLLIGEWGSKMDMANDIKWFNLMISFIIEHQLNYTYWCFNPNSHDTGGIVLEDYNTVDTTKYELIKPTLWMDSEGKGIGLDHVKSLGSNGTNVTEFYNQ